MRWPTGRGRARPDGVDGDADRGGARGARAGYCAVLHRSRPLRTALETGAAKVADPVWRMPFHTPYETMIEPGIADLDNAPSGGFAGSITAALFLRRFAGDHPYAHFDIYGWSQTAPGAAQGRRRHGRARAAGGAAGGPVAVSETFLVAEPLVDLCRSPNGPRDRQLRMGERVTSAPRDRRLGRGHGARDGYAGAVPRATLDTGTVTHRVRARATHVYAAPDFKTPRAVQPRPRRAAACAVRGGPVCRDAAGFVPRAHLAPVETYDSDPVAVAELHLGTPYLWGGDSPFGIDCSGLVQVGCLACGLACPGDSGPQMEALGTALPEDAPLQRGDLLFWRGHVAWVAGPDSCCTPTRITWPSRMSPWPRPSRASTRRATAPS